MYYLEKIYKNFYGISPNNRTVVSEAGELVQVTHYYPFGGVFGDEGMNAGMQPYKYNGKELDHMHGLDWYDYGARMFAPALPLWNAMDPMAEKYYHISPYAYCLNNPVNAIDPDGRKIVDTKGRQMLYYDSEGKIHFTKYANIDARILVNCLNLTRTGSAMLEQLIKSDIKVHFQISDKTVVTNKSITYGTTLQGNMNKKDNYGKTYDGKSIKESTITVYMGSIKESIKDGSGLKHEGLTEEQAIGAVVGHEAVHGTNKKEISTDLQYELKGKNNPYREILPNIIERNIIYEYKNEKLYE